MKTIKLLKTLIDIYYYLFLIAITFSIITLPILLFTDQSYEISMADSQTFDLGGLSLMKTFIVFFSIVLMILVFFYTIRLVKRTVDVMYRGKYFSSLVIKNFKKIGQLFIVCAIGSSFLKFILKAVTLNIFSFKISSTFLLFLIMGLFMMFLSEVFGIAKRHKNENELTI